MQRPLRPQFVSAAQDDLSADGAIRVIDPGTAIGPVRLTVSDLERSQDFYERVLGLRGRRRWDRTMAFAGPDGEELVELRGDPAAPPLDARAPGLFHLAILVPSRQELARSLWRLAVQRWPLEGASDHLVSEALYLSDPDGNGIEIYRDRPRSEWRYDHGELRMATLALDLDDVLGELDGARTEAETVLDSVGAGTRVGHIHLRVSDLADAADFYGAVLGFDVTVRSYPGALFVSAGGYHHHIGLNVWHSAGARPSVPGAVGLRDFDVVVPDERSLEDIVGRVRGAGIELEATDGGTLVHDPAGNALVLRSR